MDEHDRDRWDAVLRGDAAAFDAFYRETAPRLQAFLRQLTGSAHVAEDVAQDTFTQLWKRPMGFAPERGSSLRAYVYGIARKQAAEWWRKRKTIEALEEQSGPACRMESDSAVRDALARLPEEQRTLLWLREVEGHSYAELAAVLDVPVGTVRSRLFTAREALRAIWLAKHKERSAL